MNTNNFNNEQKIFLGCKDKNLFGFYKNEGKGNIIVDNDGFIKSFLCNDEKNKFSAKFIKEEGE